jgi:hypothetical protein
MNLEWIAEDFTDTIGHATKLELEGIKSLSPYHTVTARDLDLANRLHSIDAFKNSNMVLAGEALSYQTFSGVGSNSVITNELFKRITAKVVKNKINLVHLRVPSSYDIGTTTINVGRVSDFQVSGIVGVQLEANASAVIPPVNQGISQFPEFQRIYQRTKVEIQTFRKEKEIMGYIPTTKSLDIVQRMIEQYIKDDIRIFGVDFSSSPLNRWLLRTVVSNIRRNLKIKGKVGENKDKQYYLHVFDVTSSKKSALPISPITDVLTHTYGVDSTSGVMWGGGKLVKDKLRYFNMQDYGAYQINTLDGEGVRYDRTLISGNASEVYDKLRVHKNVNYIKECDNIIQTLNGNTNSGYAPYVLSKVRASKQVREALLDVQEIRGNS